VYEIILQCQLGTGCLLRDSFRADLFMSKLTSRSPNLGYLGHEVKSRVNLCRVNLRFTEKFNQSLLIRELNLVHLTVLSYYDNFADYNDWIHYAKRCHGSLSSGSSIYDCERFADVVIYMGQLRSCTNCRLTSQYREVNCASYVWYNRVT